MSGQEERELMELAAKACGFQWKWFGEKLCTVRDFSVMRHDHWNPLGDDGDALRLAVKLQLQVTPGTYNKDEFSAFHSGKGEANEYRHFLQDEYSATRRAIVRAAAEIGRSMP